MISVYGKAHDCSIRIKLSFPEKENCIRLF